MEKLFCSIGDTVRIRASVTTTPWPGEVAVEVEAGAAYEVIGLVGWGWDLRRLSGKGPDELRILNSDMHRYLTVIGRDS